jgi:2-iminobutanoate/2-iminopropanoate deaminase
MLNVMSHRKHAAYNQSTRMPIIEHNPPSVFPPYRAYSHAAEVRGESRLLFISGLNGYKSDGLSMPESFEDQAELIWKHLKTILAGAGMTVNNLVSLRTYLADPGHDEANALMRVKHLGAHRPASTVVCCRLLEAWWKLEVEATAAA